MMRNNNEEFHKTHPTELTEQLYLSAARAVTSKALLDLGITSIINATLELPTVAYQKQETIQIAVEDRIASKLYIYFDLVADKIQQVHLSGGKIMVYCRAGQSRSATLCIAYFMKYHGLSFEDAFQFVRSKRPIIHPNIGFIRQLKEYDAKLKIKGSIPSLAIAITPLPARKNNCLPLSLPLPIIAVESIVPNDNVENELDEIESLPVNLDLAFVRMHDQCMNTLENYEIQVVNTCEKLEDLKYNPDKTITNFHHPQSVANVREEDIGDSTGYWDPNLTRSKSLRTAFTRLSKPNEIAVSFMNLALDLALISNRITPFKLFINKEYCSSDFSELHQAYEVLEEVPDVCLSEIPDIKTSAKNLLDVIDHSIICKPHLCPSYSFIIPLCDVEEIVSMQNKTLEKSSKRTFSRNSSFKGHINFCEKSQNVDYSAYSKSNLKAVSSIDASNNLRKANREYCNDFLFSTVCFSPILLWEKCTMLPSSSITLIDLKTNPLIVRQSFKSVIITAPCILSSVNEQTKCQSPEEGYHKLDFSITEFETCQFAISVEHCYLGCENIELGKAMNISRKYPYYCKSQQTSAIEMFQAKEEAHLNIQWFQESYTKIPNNTVKLIRKVSNCKPESKPILPLRLNWASDSLITSEAGFIIDMADHNWTEEHALIVLADKVCFSFEETLNQPLLKTDIIGKFYVPHYNPILLQRYCDVIFFSLVQIFEPQINVMNNIYSAPTTKYLFAKGKVLIHQEFKVVAVQTIPQIKEREEFVEEIPEQICDLNTLKIILANENSSSKCNIWLDVFKRTIMKLRPTFATQSYERTLETVCINTSASLECQSLLLPISTVIKALAESEIMISESSSACCEEKFTFDKIFEFSNISQIKKNSEQFEIQISIADNYIIEYNPSCWEIALTFQGSYSLTLQQYATSSVSFPNKLYTMSYTDVMGSTVPYNNTEEHKRTAFQVVSKLHSVVSHQFMTHLTCSKAHPAYQFVQDVEDWPDTLIHSIEAKEFAHTVTIDTLWFFSLDPVTKEEESPYSNYLLFLPDSDSASLIGKEIIEGSNMAVVNTSQVVEEIIQDVKGEIKIEDTLDWKTSEKQVSFLETRNSGQKSKPKVRTIYYGRDRSKGRPSLLDVHSSNNRRNRSLSKHNETEVMHNLAKSVNEANSILARRRERGRYDSPSTPLIPRGRELERRSTSKNSPYSKPDSEFDSDTSAPKILRIVNIAQNLFTKGETRLEMRDRLNTTRPDYTRKYQ